MTTKPVLAVHAAGDPRHPLGSGQLFDWLGRELGDDYQVIAPTMPNPDEPHFGPWRDRIREELDNLHDGVMLFGHSFGGSVLIKYLAEVSLEEDVLGLFLVSVPYWGPGGWQYDEYDFPDGFAERIPHSPVFLYHSRNDPEVPFNHLGLFAEKLPNATVRPLEGEEHSFTGGLPQLAADIKSLT